LPKRYEAILTLARAGADFCWLYPLYRLTCCLAGRGESSSHGPGLWMALSLFALGLGTWWFRLKSRPREANGTFFALVATVGVATWCLLWWEVMVGERVVLTEYSLLLVSVLFTGAVVYRGMASAEAPERLSSFEEICWRMIILSVVLGASTLSGAAVLIWPLILLPVLSIGSALMARLVGAVTRRWEHLLPSLGTATILHYGPEDMRSFGLPVVAILALGVLAGGGLLAFILNPAQILLLVGQLWKWVGYALYPVCILLAWVITSLLGGLIPLLRRLMAKALSLQLDLSGAETQPYEQAPEPLAWAPLLTASARIIFLIALVACLAIALYRLWLRYAASASGTWSEERESMWDSGRFLAGLRSMLSRRAGRTPVGWADSPDAVRIQRVYRRLTRLASQRNEAFEGETARHYIDRLVSLPWVLTSWRAPMAYIMQAYERARYGPDGQVLSSLANETEKSLRFLLNGGFPHTAGTSRETPEPDG